MGLGDRRGGPSLPVRLPWPATAQPHSRLGGLGGGTEQRTGCPGDELRAGRQSLRRQGWASACLPCLPRAAAHPAELREPLLIPAPFSPARIPLGCPTASSPSSAPHPPHAGHSKQRSKGAPPITPGVLRGRVGSRTAGFRVPGDSGSTLTPADKNTEIWGSFCTYLFRRVRCDPGTGQRVRQSPAGGDGKGHHGGGSRAQFPPGLEDARPWHRPLQLQGGRTDGQPLERGKADVMWSATLCVGDGAPWGGCESLLGPGHAWRETRLPPAPLT